MPITRALTVLPSTLSSAIASPTPTCAAAANEASTTTPSGLPWLSQLPATTSGADIAGSAVDIPSSCTDDLCEPNSRVAGA